jgi:hypothetical protein
MIGCTEAGFAASFDVVPLSKLREWRDANSGSPREMSRTANTR